MYIIIAGCGKVGSGLAEKLSWEGHDVVVVESDESALARLGADFNGLKIVGVPIDQDVLKRAGIDKADAIAAVTQEDNMNIMVSQIAKTLYNVPRVIARIYNPARESIFHQFGLETICPTNLSVDIMASIITGKTMEATCTIGSTTIGYRYEKPDRKHHGSQIKDIVQPEEEFIFGVIKGSEFTFAFPYVIVEEDDLFVIARKLD
jgi:trk system potassium uptake protein TrkA